MKLFKVLTETSSIELNPLEKGHSVQVRINAARFIDEYSMQRGQLDGADVAWELENDVQKRWDQWLDYNSMMAQGRYKGKDRYDAIELRFYWLMRSMIKVSTSPRWSHSRLVTELQTLHDHILQTKPQPSGGEPGALAYLTTSFKVHCLLGEWGGPNADPGRGAFHVGRLLLDCKGGGDLYREMGVAAKERQSKRPDYKRFYGPSGQGFLGSCWGDLKDHRYKDPQFSQVLMHKKWSIDSLVATRTDVDSTDEESPAGALDPIVIKDKNEIYRFGAVAQVALQLASADGRPPPETLLVGYWSPSKLHLKGINQHRKDAATIGYTLVLTSKSGVWSGTLKSRAGRNGDIPPETKEYTVEAELTTFD